MSKSQDIRRVEEIGVSSLDGIQDLSALEKPVVLRGLVGHWPLVEEARKSSRNAIAYLRRFDVGHEVGTFFAEPDDSGRLGYLPDLSGLNFSKRFARLSAVLDDLEAFLAVDRPPVRYVGSSSIDASLPGLRDANDLAFDALGIVPIASIWLGNRTIVGCHYDALANVACCAAGRRRFTLFPPDQIANLYPGPLEPTPGGQVTTLVDLSDPDFVRFPRFAQALPHAEVAELEAGDALFIPPMWWHEVEAFDPFNVLINYWWSSAPRFMGLPVAALEHAIFAIRSLPKSEREAWKALFDYYAFDDPSCATAHLPDHALGNLGPLSEGSARRMRASLIKHLNR